MAYCTFTLIKPREPYHILGGDTYQLYINIRAEQLIDLIVNCDYWEEANVQIVIVMSIILMLYK